MRELQQGDAFQVLLDAWVKLRKFDRDDLDLRVEGELYDITRLVERAIIEYRCPKTVGDVLDWPIDPPDRAEYPSLKWEGLGFLIDRDCEDLIEDTLGYHEFISMDWEKLAPKLSSDPTVRQMDGWEFSEWLDREFPAALYDEEVETTKR